MKADDGNRLPSPEGAFEIDPEGIITSPKGSGRRLRGAVAHYLGSAIVSGAIAPGERLTGEVENAEALDISRSAYREAVQVLTAKGLVESRPKIGTIVLPRNRWNLLDPAVLAWAFSGEPDMEFVRDLFELRSIVEPNAARIAAERRDKSDIKAMKSALARMRRHTLATEEGRAADRDFHDALLRATHNNALVALSASISAAVNWTTKFKQRTRVLPRDPVPDHARAFDAIAAGDGEAASVAMRVLVDLALEDTRSAMQAHRAEAGAPESDEDATDAQ
ncbi:MAG: FadR family transcriptional regulator [Sphingobium sp.]|nr:FadR family transcriptional regulator [Sphingobium sp.]